jgi:AcrR family transcriptional regulator
MSTTRPLRLERRPEARMHELLEAALLVFARKGYRTARLDDVAEAAGVTKGAIYHYFDTKEALLLAVVEHYQALALGRAEDALRDRTAPAATRIRLLMRKVFSRRAAATADQLLTLLIRDVATEVPTVHNQWLHDGPGRMWSMLRALVDEGKARGEFRQDADGDVGARVLLAGVMLQLMWQQHAGDVDGLAIDEDRLIDSSTELFLAGLREAGTRGGRRH